MTTPREWADVQTMGLKKTFGADQYVALNKWLEDQAHGGWNFGRQWGPRYWVVDQASRPITDDHLSHHLRVHLRLDKTRDRLRVGTERELVWVNTVRWMTIKEE
jgi:hypothetical protein